MQLGRAHGTYLHDVQGVHGNVFEHSSSCARCHMHLRAHVLWQCFVVMVMVIDVSHGAETCCNLFGAN